MWIQQLYHHHADSELGCLTGDDGYTYTSGVVRITKCELSILATDRLRSEPSVENAHNQDHRLGTCTSYRNSNISVCTLHSHTTSYTGLHDVCQDS